MAVLEILFYVLMFALGYFGLPFAEKWMRTWGRTSSGGRSCPCCNSRDVGPITEAGDCCIWRCTSCDSTWSIEAE